MPSISSIYSQTNQFPVTASGVTGFQYFALTQNGTTPPTGSIFIIKYMSVACTGGFDSSLTSPYSPAVLCCTSDDNIGTNQHIFASYNPGTSTTNLQIYTAIDEAQSPSVTAGGTQIISTQPYIGVNVNVGNSGSHTVYITFTYIVIPGGNALTSNFMFGVGAGGTGGAITSPINASTTNSRFVKSILFSNINAPTGDLTIQMVALNQAGNTITGYINQTYVIHPYQTACYESPLFIQANGSVLPGFTVTGPTDVQFYMSYCVGPA